MPIITGTEAGETLSGTAGDDTINALGGNDTINLSTGHDTIDGGTGTDRLSGNASTLGVPAGARSYTITANTFSGGAGTLDTTFSNIESVTFTDAAGYDVTLDASAWGGALSVTVGLGDHVLTGGAVNDSFRVQGGKATIDGGTGTDSLLIDAAHFDLPAGPRSYTLTTSLTESSGALDIDFTNLERVILTETSGNDVTFDGSEFAGTIQQISVGLGTHVLSGGAAVDAFTVDGGNATIDGGAGEDFLAVGTAESLLVVTRVNGVMRLQSSEQVVSASNIEDLTIYATNFSSLFVDASQYDSPIDFVGSIGEDAVAGGSAGDLFSGFGAGDILAGLGGADTFAFNTLSQFNGLTILDLTPDDLISFVPPQFGPQPPAVTFIGNGNFTGVAGQYRYLAFGGATYLLGDSNGDTYFDSALTIANGAFILAETAPGSKILQIAGTPAAPDPAPNTLTGTGGTDVLEGGAGNDQISGLGGDDLIDGGADDDQINGGAGHDTIFGGAGNDTIDGGEGFDTVRGGDGNDTLTGTGFESDWMFGGRGDDVITANGGVWYLSGGDVYDGGWNGGWNLAIHGEDLSEEDDGNDHLTLINGHNSSLDGGSGNDVLEATGATGQLFAFGGSGNDTIDVAGSAWLIADGGDGDDVITISGTGQILAQGSGGNDDITLENYGSGYAFLGAGNDILRLRAGTIDVSLNEGRDTVIITAAAAGFMTINHFNAGEQGDRLDLSIYGADPFGTGTLTMSASGPTTFIDHAATGMRFVLPLVNLANLSSYNLGVPNPNYSPVGMTLDDAFADQPEVEFAGELTGADGNDTIRGFGGNDVLFGSGGNDLIEGGNHDDLLSGGTGNDTLDGGEGLDTAQFTGDRSAYTLTAENEVLHVQGPDGTDTLTGIERLQFADGTYAYGPSGHGSSALFTASFGASASAGGWTDNRTYPRTVADIDGDGKGDLVGFGSAGVYAALTTPAGGPGTTYLALNSFGASDAAGGWSDSRVFPRTLGDINGDGKADLVGFGAAGVYASLATGDGEFGPVFLALDSFGSDAAAGGWSDNQTFPRLLADVNGDGMDDLIGFGAAGVYASLATEGGAFGAVFLAANSFGSDAAAGGWSNDDLYTRTLADVNGDGRDDIVGFGSAGTYAALANADGTFGATFLAYAGFGAADTAGGWTSNDRFYRTLGDVDGDGDADLVGFGAAGVFVAEGNGAGGFAQGELLMAAFGTSDAAGGWTSQNSYPRMLADINGDGVDDIVGFGGAGVFTAMSLSDWVLV